MLLKSENKIIEEITRLSDKEVFRVYHKALMSGDVDFSVNIFERLNTDKRWVLANTHLLSLLKYMALQMILISKASMAVSFYNSLLSTFLGKEYPKELYGKQFTEKRFEEIQRLREKIEKLDMKAGGALDLEEYDFADGMSPEFDYWIGLADDLLKVIQEITLSSKLNHKGLEQRRNN